MAFDTRQDVNAADSEFLRDRFKVMFTEGDKLILWSENGTEFAKWKSQVKKIDSHRWCEFEDKDENTEKSQHDILLLNDPTMNDEPATESKEDEVPMSGRPQRDKNCPGHLNDFVLFNVYGLTRSALDFLSPVTQNNHNNLIHSLRVE